MRIRIFLLFSFIVFSAFSKTLFLFDVDGTLTLPRQKVELSMLDKLQELKDAGYSLALVGGSDLTKIKEQMGEDVGNRFDYVFAENGLVAFKNSALINRASIKDYLTNQQLNEFISFCLHYIADLDIPTKRGTFIEFRNGMINVSPVGRNCTQEERIAFNQLDKEKHIREYMIEILQKRFAHLNLRFSIGGQISIDVFPQGWDKTYCLRFLNDFDTILFFGDKTASGGNDYEIFTSSRTSGQTVCGPEDLMKKLDELLKQAE
ncbi:MAG: Phosphomannomutase [candidate division TM6 bacterium GW2011_GWE2_36_25]|nr:MAG: Phosphomannomutase [candidate division TM6 bacterium GW2011_GWF2_36_131]KKQ02776.1 MAG: Phosphomannomutase [candidate division TM6 bacterium GW2011_GWE2_36_25]